MNIIDGISCHFLLNKLFLFYENDFDNLCNSTQLAELVLEITF